MNNRKRNVLLTAQRLFIEKGYISTSVQDIIDEAKISKGTFYNYFSSKNECVIAIIEDAKEEVELKRRKLLLQLDISGKDMFIEQLSVRLEVYRERNLIPIFIAIFHTRESELRDLVKMGHEDEIFWLSKRLVDIFGEQTKEVSVDCSILMLGMIQQIQHPWTAKSKGITEKQLVQFVMRRIESLIYDMANEKDSLVDARYYEKHIDEAHITKEHVLQQLKDLYEQNKEELQTNQLQLLEFVLDELNLEQPRKFLLATVMQTFSTVFKESSLYPQSKALSTNLWKVIDSIS